MMTITIRDEEGEYHLDVNDVLVLLAETFKLGLAYGIERYVAKGKVWLAVELVNQCLEKTYGDRVWLEKYIHQIVLFAKHDKTSAFWVDPK